MTSFANLGLQHPCWLLPPPLSSTHVDVQRPIHPCPVHHHQRTFHGAPERVFCEARSNIYVGGSPRWWDYFSPILSRWRLQFRTRRWRCPEAVLPMNARGVAFCLRDQVLRTQSAHILRQNCGKILFKMQIFLLSHLYLYCICM